MTAAPLPEEVGFAPGFKLVTGFTIAAPPVPAVLVIVVLFVDACTIVKNWPSVGLGGKLTVKGLTLVTFFKSKIDVVLVVVTEPLLTGVADNTAWLHKGNFVIIVPVLILICSTPLVSNESVLAVAAEKPVFVLPVNCIDGVAALPAGCVKVPVIVSPALSTLSEALPVTLPIKAAVIVPAEKLPEASRLTIVLAVLALVAALAATVAVATLAAVWPPTVLTTVAL